MNSLEVADSTENIKITTCL